MKKIEKGIYLNASDGQEYEVIDVLGEKVLISCISTGLLEKTSIETFYKNFIKFDDLSDAANVIFKED